MRTTCVTPPPAGEEMKGARVRMVARRDDGVMAAGRGAGLGPSAAPLIAGDQARVWSVNSGRWSY